MTALPSPAALVPHAGSMCLLDGITSWDETHVSCVSASHRRSGHPLRRDGSLDAIHLLEYAVQATAVHGALAAGDDEDRMPVKYLVAARDFELYVTRLDDVRVDLRIDAERLLAMGDGVIYGFRVSADSDLLAEGRLSVASPGGAPS